MSNEKIISVAKAKTLSKSLQKTNKIVLCHGAFDLMHTGHIRHLQKAKQKGDVLFVSITADEFILKGPGRPVFNHNLRAENIAALLCVDYVFISYSQTAINSISSIMPTYYAKGSDYKNTDDDLTNNIQKEIDETKKNGGSIFYTDEIVFSSSSLLNTYFNQFSEQVKDFLSSLKSKYTFNEICNRIDELNNLNVLVIGDAIIDEYNYVSPLGQTGKGGVLSVAHKHCDTFAGGSLAVANHIANFVKNVDLITGISADKEDESFIRSSLSKNIKPKLLKILNKTLRKTRFLDDDLLRFFEIYKYDGLIDLEKKNTTKVITALKNKIDQYDLVVATDFGNGFFNSKIRDFLSEKSKFLAVNTQINSANRGYHAVNKYKKANFISLNEPEARLTIHDTSSPIEIVAEEICTKICKADFLTITRGKKGIFSISKKPLQYFLQPALAGDVVDRVGAGDAYLALSSLLLVKKLDIEIASFIGSVYTAFDVSIVGIKELVSKIKVLKYINTLFK